MITLHPRFPDLSLSFCDSRFVDRRFWKGLPLAVTDRREIPEEVGKLTDLPDELPLS